MKKNIFITTIILICLLSIFLGGCKEESRNEGLEGKYEVTDIYGKTTIVKEKPHKILTLSMDTDIIALGLVPTENMVAINDLCDDENSSNIVELANKISHKIKNPSVEEIISLNPDMVIIPDWGDITNVEALRSVGINVIVVKGASNLADIRENITLMSLAFGEKERGKKLLEMMESRLAIIAEKVKKIPSDKRKSVALISLMSSYGGAGSLFDEECQQAGVINALAVGGLSNGQKLTKEMLIKIDPDILFLPSYNSHGNFDVEAFRNKYIEDSSLQKMKAIVNKSFREPRDAYIYSGSQDVVLGIEEIAYSVYGDEYGFSHLENQVHLTAVE